MKYYGTKNNKDYGFYLENFEGAVEISDKYWLELLENQNNGKLIIPFNGGVIAINENEYSFENGCWKKLSDDEAKIKQLNLQNAIRIEELQNELENLDKKRIRAIAEPSLMDDSTTWLEYYNTEIVKLRKEIAELS